MTDRTKIEWCDSTFNGWEGCQKVGPGCDHCYAETRNARFAGGTAINWGPGAPRRRTSVSNWRKPLVWNKREFFQCEDCGERGFGKPWESFGFSMGKLDGGHECEACGSRSMESVRMRVFCSSLADVFDNAVDPQWRRDLFDLIELTPNLDWLLLTKRIGNVPEMVARAKVHDWLQGRPNVWLGATVVNQEEADRDIPKLLAVPARRRFLSMEPLLGPVDLRLQRRATEDDRQDMDGYCSHITTAAGAGLHWIIVGGESGPGARPMHPDWARGLRDQCTAAGVPYLFKQWGEWAPTWNEAHAHMGRDAPPDPAGGASIYGTRIGAFPNELSWPVVKIGKKAAGRLLDGVQHDGFPEVR